MTKQVAVMLALANAATSLSLLLLISYALMASAAEEPEKQKPDGGDQETAQAPIESFLPENGTLFRKDAVDKDSLEKMDCHLRNIDYCLASVVGASGKILPEIDAELESRCDEMKASMTCLSIYENRCRTLKVFSSIFPSTTDISKMRPNTQELSKQASALNLTVDSLLSTVGGPLKDEKIELIDLLQLCDPDKKGTQKNIKIRKKLFELSKCINARVPAMKPCIEDVKTALQLLFEPSRALPKKPFCCAWGRFRSCAMDAMDNVCGFNSFKQLESLLEVGSMSMLKNMQRACGAEQDHNSPYCKQIIPPSGLKVPARRGQKASKLVRVLDMVQIVGI